MSRSRYSDWGWPAYVPVAERRRKAQQKIKKLQKKGQSIAPVEISGRTIAKTFWGNSWCLNLEAYSDYANRLPRGRTYVRNGSVVDLQIGDAMVRAMVSGSSLYQVEIGIERLSEQAWKKIRSACLGKIGSLLDLLLGRLSRDVMEVVTRPQAGLFPAPAEISFKCSCPDWASMCKHVAAALYGVGARLDHEPELLFRLRGVDQQDLISVPEAADLAMTGAAKERIIAEDDLAGIFGIELDGGMTPLRQEQPEKPKRGRPASKPKQAATAGKEKPAPALPSKSLKIRAALRDQESPAPESPKKGRKPSRKAAVTAKPQKSRRPSRKAAAPASTTVRPPGTRKAIAKAESPATGKDAVKKKAPAGTKGATPSTDTSPRRRGRPPGRKRTAPPIPG